MAHLLQLSERDNIAVATGSLAAGQELVCAGRTIRLLSPIPLGHKVALRSLAAGEKIVKFDVPIGSATRDIAPGEHVHTHNLKSDYLPTYTLDGANPYLAKDKRE